MEEGGGKLSVPCCGAYARAMGVPMQLPLLRERWRVILAGACFQYVHGMATQLAHRMHQPLARPLHDVGFELLPVRSPRAWRGLYAMYAEHREGLQASGCLR